MVSTVIFGIFYRYFLKGRESMTTSLRGKFRVRLSLMFGKGMRTIFRTTPRRFFDHREEVLYRSEQAKSKMMAALHNSF